jgi:hemoglobin
MPEAPYDQLGGDATVHRLVERFYDRMDTLAEYDVIRRLHPADLSGSREKLYLFLSGWLGGPQRYAAKYGHPMLRARHLPFAIGLAERDAWLACMQQAMHDCGIDAALATALLDSLYKTADWMRNKEG